VGEGYSVGALCSADPSAEYAEISSLLLDAARVKTVLIASAAPEYDESCIHVADVYGLVFWDYDTDCIQNGTGLTYASLITAYLEYRPARLDARILCCDATDACLPSVLSYINDNGFTARAPSEVTELWYKKRMAPEGVGVYNPAFDVTDAELITGIITERGIVRAPYEEGFRALGLV